SQFSVSFETPEGSSLQYTRSRADAILRTLATLDGVDYTYTTIGAGATGTVTNGSVYVRLVPRDERSKTQQELMVEAREKLSSLYGARVAVSLADADQGGGKPIQVNLRGPDVAVLQQLSDTVLAIMQSMRGLVDIESSLGQPRPEYRIDVNRDLANELGLDVGQIAMAVRPLLAGQAVTTWQDAEGEERDVVVQVDPTRRASFTDLATLPVATPMRAMTGAAPTVPLGQIATIETGSAPAQIDRSELERVATVSSNLEPGYSVQEASGAINAALADLDLP